MNEVRFSNEILYPQSIEEWLMLRLETCGASEAPALLGVHPWLTVAELWALKTRRMNKKDSPSKKRGRLLESVSLDFLREERPSWTITPNPMPSGKFYRNLPIRLSCTPDAFAVNPERHGFGIVQIKSVKPSEFRKKWLIDGVVEAPIYAVIQAMLEMFLTGARWACIGPMVVDDGVEMPLVEVTMHEPIIAKVIARAREFWALVAADTPPEFDFAKDGEVLSNLYAGETGETVDMSGLNWPLELIAEDKALMAAIKTAADRREEIKNMFAAELKEANIATYNGTVIATRKIVSRKGHTAPTVQYPKITLRRNLD